MLQSRKTRALFIQTVIGLALIVCAVLMVRYVQQSLAAQNISSGFGFLWRTTGWDVSFSLIPYTVNDPYWRVLLVGILNTLFLGLIGLLFATIIGLVVAVFRTSENPVLSFLGTFYLEAIRNVPMILQAFFWYAVFTHFPPPRQAINVADSLFFSARGIFVPIPNISLNAGLVVGAALFMGLVVALVINLLPRQTLSKRVLYPRMSRLSLLLGVLVAAGAVVAGHTAGEPFLQLPALKGLNFTGGLRVSPEFAALLTSMALYGGAFLSEIIRAGFISISKGQVEAAHALGLSAWQVFSRVRLPLAVRAVLPTLTNQYVWLLKATTLGIAVGFSDFFLVVSTAINQSGQTIELIFILMAGFLIINNVLAAIMNLINRRIALRGTQLRI
jgi:general L-amino acid transport system permease protein